MTATRFGVVLLVSGVILVVLGALGVGDPDLLDVAGVALIVFGAVGVSIQTDSEPPMPPRR